MAVDYIEQARMILKADQAKREARAVNRELKGVLTTVQRLNRTNVRMKVAVSNPSSIKKELDRLARTRDVRLRARISNPVGIKNEIERLTKTRDVRIRTSVVPPAGDPRGRTLTDADVLTRDELRRRALSRLEGQELRNKLSLQKLNSPRNNGQDTVGQGIRDALRPRQIGRDMARSFTISVGHEFFMVARQITREIGRAPLSLDDARSRVRIAGRSAEELAIIEKIANDLSKRFQGVTEAEIIANSGEVTGRFGDLALAENTEAAATAMERLARNTQILGAALPQGSADNAANQARLIETAIQQVGATRDPEFASDISTAVLQAVIASGGDLNPADVKRTLQQIPAARAGIGDATLLAALLARDEGGRRSTGNLNQLFSDQLRGNLNDADLATQLARGIRNKDGSSDVFAALQNDLIGGIQSEIIPRLQAINKERGLTEGAEGFIQTDFSGLEQGTEEFSQAIARLRAAIDNDLGFSKQGGVSVLTDFIANMEEIIPEFERARKANPDFAIDSPSLRLELKAVQAQFQNVAADAIDPLLPAVKGGLDTISNALNDVQKDEASTAAAALTIGAAAIPVALGAALQGLMDPSTRATSASALALTGSAAALSGSATALTAAAVAQTAAGMDGSKKGRIAKALAFIGAAVKGVGPLAALVATNGGSRVSDEVERGNHPSLGMNLDNLPPSEREKFRPKTTEELREIAKALEKVATDTRQRQDAAAELAVMSQFVAAKFDPTATPTARAIPTDEVARIVAILERSDIARRESEFPNTGPAGEGGPVLTLEPDLPSEMAQTMIAGKGGLDASIMDMAETLSAFGPAASEQLVSGAEQFGQRAGAAFTQTVGAIDVNVPNRPNSSEKPALATGKTKLE